MGVDTTLTTPQAAAEAGITFRQLDYWTRIGVAFPHAEARGQGSRRVWTRGEVEVLKSMATWTRLGVDLRNARALAEQGAYIAYDTSPLDLFATVA